ncbi:efhand domain-containing protein [Rhizoctonia solani AG-1 IA]|uniref:Efhand domain-containing protein n=1 Tax=Thanatephorus cucumeris (strain AG1-IA) TaxID=983506 RepID=L8WJ91_THACA|nr:efhand domain-containing protein [Rhizoctonia solani AG-1 IA]
MKKYPVYAHGLMSHSHIAVIVPSQPLGDLTPWVPRSRVNPVSRSRPHQGMTAHLVNLRLVDVFTTIAPASKLILVPADGTEQLEDGDGQITTTELSSLLHALSTPIHNIDNIIAQADANEDGALDLGEFLLLMSEKLNSGQKTDTELRQVFDRFDKDGSGSIERGELGKAVELAMIMREVDADGDGRVSFEGESLIGTISSLTLENCVEFKMPHVIGRRNAHKSTNPRSWIDLFLTTMSDEFTTQPAPSVRRIQGGGLNPGLAGSGEAAAFHATGPQIPNEEVLSTLDKPLPRGAEEEGGRIEQVMFRATVFGIFAHNNSLN